MHRGIEQWVLGLIERLIKAYKENKSGVSRLLIISFLWYGLWILDIACYSAEMEGCVFLFAS